MAGTSRRRRQARTETLGGPSTAPTCASWLGVVEPFLTEPLVAPAARRRLREVARYLPGEALGVVEIRLGRQASVADLSIRLTSPAQAAELASRVKSPHLRAFLTRRRSRLGHPAPVAAVWLEFDLGRAPQGVPEPVVCVQLHGPPETRWLLDELLPALHGRPLSATQEAWLCRALDALPPSARLLYAFSLAARSDAVRLEIDRLDPAAMSDYLERWAPGDAGRRLRDLMPLAAGCDRYHLSFDVAGEVSPRLGLECGFARLPHREPRWTRLFDRLVAAGLCGAEQRDAVLAWPGTDTLWTAADRWPEAAVGPGGHCVRCLSHVKLVSLPDRPPTAKAYLIFEHLHNARPVAQPA